jgi:hypothetical protein
MVVFLYRSDHSCLTLSPAMTNQHAAQSPQSRDEGLSGGMPDSHRNTGEGAASALALLKGRKRVDELVNRSSQPESESSGDAHP